LVVAVAIQVRNPRWSDADRTQRKRNAALRLQTHDSMEALIQLDRARNRVCHGFRSGAAPVLPRSWAPRVSGLPTISTHVAAYQPTEPFLALCDTVAGIKTYNCYYSGSGGYATVVVGLRDHRLWLAESWSGTVVAETTFAEMFRECPGSIEGSADTIWGDIDWEVRGRWVRGVLSRIAR
jgi:hypothetical protein